MRVSGADDFAEQNERRVGEVVFLEDRIERNVVAVMAELAAVNVKAVSFGSIVEVIEKRDAIRLRPHAHLAGVFKRAVFRLEQRFSIENDFEHAPTKLDS